MRRYKKCNNFKKGDTVIARFSNDSGDKGYRVGICIRDVGYSGLSTIKNIFILHNKPVITEIGEKEFVCSAYKRHTTRRTSILLIEKSLKKSYSPRKGRKHVHKLPKYNRYPIHKMFVRV